MVNLNYNEELLFPAFKKNNIAVFMSTTPQWSVYAGVLINSIIKNSRKNFNYDIIILEENIDLKTKNKLKKLSRKNISVRFFNVSAFINQLNLEINSIYTIAAFYRLFAPVIFKNYDKILYLDIDTIVLSDISQFYNENISDFHFAAVQDIGIIHNSYPNNQEYFNDYCGIQNIYNSINSGVILFNIQKMIEDNVCRNFFEIAQSKYFNYADQDVLNVYYDKNSNLIKFLDCTYNYQSSINLYKNLPPNIKENHIKYKKHAKILHYLTQHKPWKTFKAPYAYDWWRYAVSSCCFYEILNIHICEHFYKYKIAYDLCKI